MPPKDENGVNPYDAYRLAKYRQAQRETNRLHALRAALRGSGLWARLLAACVAIFVIWMLVLLLAAKG